MDNNFPVVITIRISSEMNADIQRVAGSKHNRAETIRALLKEGLDNRQDLIGSRRFFQNRFRLRVNELEVLLTAYLLAILYLLAYLGELILPRLYNLGEEEKHSYSATALIKKASLNIAKHHVHFREAISPIIGAIEDTEEQPI